ncbi:MAG: PDZ domain-containing protein [bacterium]
MRLLTSLEGSIKPIFGVAFLFLLAVAVISRQNPDLSDHSSPIRSSLSSSEAECEKSGLTPDLAKSFGLGNSKGVLVAQVTENSPAEKAGLKRGDVIVEFAGKPVENSGEFRNRVSFITPGTKERITVLRDGRKMTLDATVDKLPEGDQIATASLNRSDKLGLIVQTLTKDLAAQLGYEDETGVVVAEVKPGSIAALAGIRPGTLIQEVNHIAVKNTEEFKQAFEKKSESGSVLLLLKEGQYSRFVTLKTN